ncbi:MAG: nitronate monooxygenase [Betaproteobacteria bacterium]|nr:nitronate monooxygenase [Betaproteobacteria bacterium]
MGTATQPTTGTDWLALAQAGGLRPLHLRGRKLLPIVQGGMGVGVSASGLASAVARLGGMGTISSVDLRRRHPDLMAQTGHLDKEPDARAQIDAANLTALDREIRSARAASQGQGAIAVNVMKALSAYEAYVRQALASGADALVVGAGLPLDLPDLAREHPEVALIPILSDARGVQLLVRKWEKKGRLPDAIVIEHPRLAGGHLGAAKVGDLGDARFDFEVVLPQVQAFFKQAGYEREIPLIAAGGIDSHADIVRLQGLGASGVQLGTAFAVTTECDAAETFKRILAQAKPQDLVEFVSVAGLPARAVRTPWLDKYLRILPVMQARAHPKDKCNMSFDCLQHCGLRDGDAAIGQFCIDQQLGHAMEGDAERGLFFRGAGRLPFGEQIRSVADLMRHLLTPVAPLDASAKGACA